MRGGREEAGRGEGGERQGEGEVEKGGEGGGLKREGKWSRVRERRRERGDIESGENWKGREGKVRGGGGGKMMSKRERGKRGKEKGDREGEGEGRGRGMS